jgi:hypothetical protein
VGNPEPKPSLQRDLEEVCATLGLGHGQHRLELIFVDGRLERFWIHSKHAARELGAFEPRHASG